MRKEAGALASESRVRQRQRLIEACISALYLHGPSRTTIDKVVRIAGMSPGIVNFYFETKAALLVATLDFLAAEFEARVITPLVALRDSPAHALRQLIGLYLDPEIASPRKVSVWYAFWGEASSREEYSLICGKRDLAFADLVHDLMLRLIARSGETHLRADAVALGLTGALEVIWQEIAFQEEGSIDRAALRSRCLGYLQSVFPAQFASLEPPAPPLPFRSGTAIAEAEAYEMLVAAELTLAGVAALRTPHYWPGYALVAQPPGRAAQRVSVQLHRQEQGDRSTASVRRDDYDWLALVVISAQARQIFLVPQTEIVGTSVQLNDIARFNSNFQLARGAE